MCRFFSGNYGVRLMSLSGTEQLTAFFARLAQRCPRPGRLYRLLGEYGELQVFLFDPYSIALMKIDRAFETDFEDVFYLLKSGEIDLAHLAQMLEAVAARHDEPVKLRRNFEEFRKAMQT